MKSSKLADENSSAIYDDTPIEGFGQMIMKKLGLSETCEIGRTNKKRVKPILFSPRNHRNGLGVLNNKIKSHSNKNYSGAKIIIIQGKHRGLKGSLSELNIPSLEEYLLENDYLKILLDINKEVIKVKRKYIEVIEPKSELSKSVNFSIKEESKNLLEFSKKQKLKWVLPNIIIRIISKVNHTNYYLQKANIIDIPDCYKFIVKTSDNKYIEDLSEADVETTIPKLGENIIILTSENRGEIGKLLGRDKKLNKVIIQLQNDFSIVTLTQDDICALIN